MRDVIAHNDIGAGKSPSVDAYQLSYNSKHRKKIDDSKSTNKENKKNV